MFHRCTTLKQSEDLYKKLSKRLYQHPVLMELLIEAHKSCSYHIIDELKKTLPEGAGDYEMVLLIAESKGLKIKEQNNEPA